VRTGNVLGFDEHIACWRCRKANQLRATLRSLPKALGARYCRILVGISGGDREYASRAPQWLAFAARLVSAVGVADAMTAFLNNERPRVDPDGALRDPSDLLGN
jgi:hypothetical protein